MKGTILAKGIILAADESRYSYQQEDVKSANEEGKPVVLSQGDEVDFIAEGQTAKEIYLTKTKLINVDFSSFSLGDDNLSTIRTLGLAGSALPILGVIPFIGLVFVIAGFICILLAIIKLSNKAASPTLKKNYIIYLVATVVATILIFIGATMGVFALIGASAKYGGASGIGIAIGVIFLIAGINGMIYAFFKEFQVYNELSRISGDKFFLYYFICTVVGALTVAIAIGYFILLAAFILQIIAWYRLREIKAA